MITIFREWKGQLGWTFTAEECREEWHAKRVSAKFMKKKYGQPKETKRFKDRRGAVVEI